MTLKEVRYMAKYRNKFRISHAKLILRNSLMSYAKGDLPTYIAVDVMNRLHKGEKEIVIPMMLSLYDKSVVQYLNEYHRCNRAWGLEFLSIAIEFTHERIKQKLGRFKDVKVELLELSDTDKRVIIKMI